MNIAGERVIQNDTSSPLEVGVREDQGRIATTQLEHALLDRRPCSGRDGLARPDALRQSGERITYPENLP